MPQNPAQLGIHDEIMLLALRDDKGTVVAEHTYRFALGGAIISELLLAERISVDEGRSAAGTTGLTRWLKDAFTEKNLVNPVSDKPLGDPVLDDCLMRITSAKRRASLKTWIRRFANTSRLNHRIAQGLCRSGVLRAEEDSVLLIFRRKIYPELDPRPERELIERLRRAIFTESREVDPRTAIVLSLADSANLLKIPFDKRDLRRRRKRIDRITSGQVLGKATKEAIQAAQAAVAAAAIVPCIAATAACH